jgi:hypothetical protein
MHARGLTPNRHFAVASSARAVPAYCLEIVKHFYPGRWPRDRTLVNFERLMHVIALPGATPGPGICPIDEASFERVSLDISPRSEQAVIVEDRHASISTLVDRPQSDCAALSMEVARMRAGQPLHELRDGGTGTRPQQKMHVVLHQAVRNNSYRLSSASMVHQLNERVIVLTTIEQHALSRPSVEDVIHESAWGHAFRSSHGVCPTGKRIASPGRAVAKGDWGQTPTGTTEDRNGV